MDETLNEYCAPIRSKLNDLETQLADVERSIQENDFNREEELERCSHIKETALTTIQTTYNDVYAQTIDENGIVSMVQEASNQQ